MDKKMMENFMNSLKNPYMFIDTDHIVRYVNKAAILHYGGRYKLSKEDMIGMSIFKCHNEKSNDMIREIFGRMQNEGLEEQLATDTPKLRIFMRSVRDEKGALLGYYERYEPPKGSY